MTLLYDDLIFQAHQTGAHPERGARIERIHQLLATSELAGRVTRVDPCPVSDAALRRVHDAGYVAAMEEKAARGGGRVEVDTVISHRSAEVARLAAGSVCDAVRRVLAGEDLTALCIVRPPGHHALPDAPMGFCLFNSVAVAAAAALDEHGLNRVLIVDWDVHHGNGTQDMFWENDRVGFFSIHRFPFYPGTGGADETGGGRGLGFTRNVPLTFGISPRQYRSAFQSELESFAARVQPELILVSAGFDAHRLDPVGSLGLEVDDFAPLTDCVLRLADQYCGGRLVSTLEGGYNLDVLPQCVATHLERLLAHRPPTSTPAE